MILKSDWKIEEKVTCGLENDMGIFTRALEVSKRRLWWDPFIQSRKCMNLKLREEFCVMTMKMMQNLKRNWLVVSKLKWGICWILSRALKSLKDWHFNGLPLFKVQNLQRHYVSWQWKMMQNLKRNCIVLKLTWKFWQILTRAPKNLKRLHCNGLLMSKVYNDWAKKVQKSYVWWHWRVMQNLKENWLVLLKMWRGNWQIFTDSKIIISFFKMPCENFILLWK